MQCIDCMFLMNYYNKNVEVDFCVPDDGCWFKCLTG